MKCKRWARRSTAVGIGLSLATLAAAPTVGADGDQPGKAQYRRRIGPDSKKIRTQGDKVFVWAGQNRRTKQTDWFDFTGSPIPAAHLQFGIGKDRIKPIDDPLFVAPDDPRLMGLPRAAYGRKEKVETSDDLRVIGYVLDGQARAYPTSLLDHHELVNDTIGGKPVTVGW